MITKHNNFTIPLMTDVARGFLDVALILDNKYRKIKEFERSRNLTNSLYTNLIQSIEIFLKVLLIIEGHNLQKLHTHKIYDLFKKLTLNTQTELKNEFNTHPHFQNLLTVLQKVNYNFVRYRYNDLTESASLHFEGALELILFSKILCKKTCGVDVLKYLEKYE